MDEGRFGGPGVTRHVRSNERVDFHLGGSLPPVATPNAPDFFCAKLTSSKYINTVHAVRMHVYITNRNRMLIDKIKKKREKKPIFIEMKKKGFITLGIKDS